MSFEEGYRSRRHSYINPLQEAKLMIGKAGPVMGPTNVR